MKLRLMGMLVGIASCLAAQEGAAQQAHNTTGIYDMHIYRSLAMLIDVTDHTSDQPVNPSVKYYRPIISQDRGLSGWCKTAQSENQLPIWVWLRPAVDEKGSPIKHFQHKEFVSARICHGELWPVPANTFTEQTKSLKEAFKSTETKLTNQFADMLKAFPEDLKKIEAVKQITASVKDGLKADYESLSRRLQALETSIDRVSRR
jgi:hypothetical protein